MKHILSLFATFAVLVAALGNAGDSQAQGGAASTKNPVTLPDSANMNQISSNNSSL